MSADLIRRAAVKLRDHAGTASPGSWVAYTNGLVWPKGDEVAVCSAGKVLDGMYIARMHPPVALALAELLEHIGDDVADERAVEVVLPKAGGGSYTAVCTPGRVVPRWDWTAALALSRAILREPEDGTS